MFRKTRFLALGLGAIVMSVAVACGGDDNGAGNGGNGGNGGDNGGDGGGAAQTSSVDVVLASENEFDMEASPDSTSAGTISFTVSNDGALPHEMKVVRTDLAHDALPTSGTGVDEGAVDVVAASAELQPGGNETVTVDLEAGSYVLICNVVGHYAGGMHIPFTVD